MMNTQKILIVDDDPNNIDLLVLDLEDNGYETLSATDGIEGWEVLHNSKQDISLILLDRMMPRMGGMEFMEKLKADEDVANIPVIMQTAAGETKQVSEGIQAGVYYYLIKPFEPEVLMPLVESAIADYANYSKMRSDLQTLEKVHLLRQGKFEARTLEDAHSVATFLANLFPDPEKMVLGISELIINGIEHGNLGITYADKTNLNASNQWQEEVKKRLAMPENRDKCVTIDFRKDSDEICLHIKDDGKGFNWKEYIEFSPERATDSHGRGIAMSKLISFDSMEYVGAGNEVVCTVKLSEKVVDSA